MDFVEALAKIEGAQSVGGQLIVHRGGRNIVVGGQAQGHLIVADTAEARAIVAEVEVAVTATAEAPLDSTGEPMPEPAPAPPEPEPEPVQHEIKVEDDVKIADKPPGRKR